MGEGKADSDVMRYFAMEPGMWLCFDDATRLAVIAIFVTFEVG